MSEALYRHLDKTGLSQVWALILADFVAKEAGKGLSANDLTDELKAKLEAIEEAAQVNVIESVKVNGVALEVGEDKSVSIVVPTGALADLDKVSTAELDDTLAALIAKLSAATTLAGYGITDAYTKTETEDAIDAKVASAYKIKGSVAFADLPTEGMVEGWMYNVTDAFVADSTFIESEQGKSYPAGTNVAYTENGWDAMGGIYDFSDFVKKEDIVALTTEEIAAICKMPEA